jgi:hypothetical protein
MEMLKVEDELMELALSVGVIAALIWGIGMSWLGFHQVPGQLSWMVWSTQLLVGILACLAVPMAFVRGRDWVLARAARPGGRR